MLYVFDCIYSLPIVFVSFCDIKQHLEILHVFDCIYSLPIVFVSFCEIKQHLKILHVFDCIHSLLIVCVSFCFAQIMFSCHVYFLLKSTGYLANPRSFMQESTRAPANVGLLMFYDKTSSKISPAEAVCCMCILTSMTYFGIRTNRKDPGQTAPGWALWTGSKMFALRTSRQLTTDEIYSRLAADELTGKWCC